MPLRIAVSGPESTGKTTLARKLAEHFEEPWVPEYSRIYFQDREGGDQLDDLVAILEGQLQLEKEKEKESSRLLFCDTEPTVVKIWAKDKFGQVPEKIKTVSNSQSYDLILLCSPDVPWFYDPLREDPHRRDYLYDLYKKELEAANQNYLEITGDYLKRFETALEAVNRLSEEVLP